MLNENIKAFRKAKGLSQEELAQRVHTVRQTISKWEKGYSVPDAEMLIKLADALSCEVSDLLGVAKSVETQNELSSKLEQMNYLNAKKHRFWKRFWITIVLIIGISFFLYLLLLIIGLGFFSINNFSESLQITP